MNSYEEYVETKQSNTLGVVGFVLSITCCLAPLGFLLSLIAIFKAPRGFAIAGLLIGGALSAFAGMLYYQGNETAKKCNLETTGNMVEYFFDGIMIAGTMNQTALAKGELPKSLDDLVIEDAMSTGPKTDPWGNPYRLRDTNRRQMAANAEGKLVEHAFFALESPGADGQWDTEDDVLPETWKWDNDAPVGLLPCQIPGTETEMPDGIDEDEASPEEDEVDGSDETETPEDGR